MGLHLEFGVSESYWGFFYGSLEVIEELLGDLLFYFSFRVRWGSLKVIRESLGGKAFWKLVILGLNKLNELKFCGISQISISNIC